MNRCGIQQTAMESSVETRSDGQQFIVCPKPRRPALINFVLDEISGLKAGSELLDLIITKEGMQSSYLHQFLLLQCVGQHLVQLPRQAPQGKGDVQGGMLAANRQRGSKDLIVLPWIVGVAASLCWVRALFFPREN